MLTAISIISLGSFRAAKKCEQRNFYHEVPLIKFFSKEFTLILIVSSVWIAVYIIHFKILIININWIFIIFERNKENEFTVVT